jgi:hypothetical protein
MNDYSDLIELAAKNNNVDPALIKAVIKTESSGNTNAVGEETKQGKAEGLGQFIPSTAISLKLKNPKDPNESIPAIAKLLAENLDRYGNPQDAIRAYHGGTDKSNWGPKTEAHVAKVFANLNQPHGNEEDQILSSFLHSDNKVSNTPLSNFSNVELKNSTSDEDIINSFLPKQNENIKSNVSTPEIKAESNGFVGNPMDLINAIGHNIASPMIGLSQTKQNLLNELVQKISPNTDIAQNLNTQTQNKNQQIANWENVYQQNTPTNLASIAGAGIGQVIPALMTGGGGLMESLGAKGSELAAQFSQNPKLIGLASLLGKATGGAAVGAGYGASQPVTNQNEYLPQKAEQIGLGAIAGSAAPIVSTGLSKAAEKGGNLIAEMLNWPTGVGSEAIKQAYLSGVNKIPEFWENLTGKVDKTEVLDSALSNLKTMQSKLSNAYKTGMIDTKNDKTVLNFNNIDKAIQDAEPLTSFKGQTLNEAAADTLSKIKNAVTDWKKLNPTDFHTPEGFDALKQKIYNITEKIPFEEKQSRAVVNKVYNAVKEDISKQAPTYSEVMKNYHEGSEAINEIKSALSLNNKASVDTQLRKLQSVMRNNVNTNYGHRLDLVQQLESEGGKAIMPALAGQAMSSLTPRGLAGGAGILNLLGVAKGALIQDPTAVLEAATLPFQSPRAVGAAAYGLGKLAGTIPKTTREQNNLLNMLMLNTAMKQQ